MEQRWMIPERCSTSNLLCLNEAELEHVELCCIDVRLSKRRSKEDTKESNRESQNSTFLYIF